MNEEEKEAIEMAKKYIDILSIHDIKENRYYDIHNLKVLLNLIEKQQKEIEALKIIHESYKEVVDKGEFISKDKIKAKIKELEEIVEFSKKQTENYYDYGAEIDILKELLEGE